MVDIHTHILFHFDDGPKLIEDSLALLRAQVQNGITELVSTSHYYSAHMSLEEFTDRRERRLAALKEAMQGEQINLRIRQGAEVYIDKLILNLKSLAPLCFEGTTNILLELPHQVPDLDEVLQLVERIMLYYNVTPVIAHVERYDCFLKKIKNLRYLKDMGCVLQADAGCFLEGFRDKRFAFKALNEGYLDVVASDCHDTDKRAPNLAAAYDAILKKTDGDTVAHLKANAAALLVPNTGERKDRSTLL